LLCSASRTVAPTLDEYTHDRLLGEVWKRTGLGARDRSIVTVAASIANKQTIEMPYYLMKRSEISAIITHLAFYAGSARRSRPSP
jgi:4-carboxymuconolactone decarboxylase